MRTAALLTLLLTGCVTIPTEVDPTNTANCTEACSHLALLGCEEGKPLLDGTSCTVFCENTQKAGHALNSACVMTIKACPEIEKCQINRDGTR
jgi:hypothetical protein